MEDIYDDEIISIGDKVSINLDNDIVRGEVFHITDEDDYIILTKRIVDKYYLSRDSLKKRFPALSLPTTRGYSFCVIPGINRDMEDFKNDYPESDNNVTTSNESHNSEYMPVPAGGINRLRDAVHSYLYIFYSYDPNYYIKIFRAIREGKTGFNMFMRDFKNYNYGYTPDSFRTLVKRAIMNEQLDLLFEEESKKIASRKRK